MINNSIDELQNKKNKNIAIDKFVLILSTVLVIIIAKIVRYTVLKESLVDASIGHGWINNIVNFDVRFTFLQVSNDSISSSSIDNATFFLAVLLNPFTGLGIDTYFKMEAVISVIWNFLLLFYIISFKNTFSFSEYCFCLLVFGCLNIFDFNPAKEPIQFLFFFAIYFIIYCTGSIRKKTLCSLLVLLLSAAIFRSYYFLIAFFFVIVKVICCLYQKILPNLNKFLKIIFGFLAILLIYFIFLLLLKQFYPLFYMSLYSAGQDRNTMANTAIPRLYNNRNNVFLYLVDCSLCVIRLLCPVELVSMGLQYSIYFAIQLFFSCFAIRCIIMYKNMNESQRLSIVLYISFLLTSATFEPDFGSWIRHEAVVLPLLFIALGIAKQKNAAIIRS